MSLNEAIFLSVIVICLMWGLIELTIWRQNVHLKSVINRLNSQNFILNDILNDLRKKKNVETKNIRNKKRK